MDYLDLPHLIGGSLLLLVGLGFKGLHDLFVIARNQFADQRADVKRDEEMAEIKKVLAEVVAELNRIKGREEAFSEVRKHG